MFSLNKTQCCSCKRVYWQNTKRFWELQTAVVHVRLFSYSRILNPVHNVSKLNQIFIFYLNRNLGDNHLDGEIPESIYTLRNLKILDLPGNKLTGRISPKIGNMTGLTKLYDGLVMRNGGALSNDACIANAKNTHSLSSSIHWTIVEYLATTTSMAHCRLRSRTLPDSNPWWSTTTALAVYFQWHGLHP